LLPSGAALQACRPAAAAAAAIAVDVVVRLRELGLMTLETRRIMADLIEVFKILRVMAGAVEGMGLVRD